MSAPKMIKPTESELEILQILWRKGLATVRKVHEELSLTKEAGYTTTFKLSVAAGLPKNFERPLLIVA